MCGCVCVRRDHVFNGSHIHLSLTWIYSLPAPSRAGSWWLSAKLDSTNISQHLSNSLVKQEAKRFEWNKIKQKKSKKQARCHTEREKIGIYCIQDTKMRNRVESFTQRNGSAAHTLTCALAHIQHEIIGTRFDNILACDARWWFDKGKYTIYAKCGNVKYI